MAERSGPREPGGRNGLGVRREWNLYTRNAKRDRERLGKGRWIEVEKYRGRVGVEENLVRGRIRSRRGRSGGAACAFEGV